MAVIFLGLLLIGVGGLIAALRSPAEKKEKPSILALDLDGVIVDMRDILESLPNTEQKTVSKAFAAINLPAAWSDRVRSFGPS